LNAAPTKHPVHAIIPLGTGPASVPFSGEIAQDSGEAKGRGY